MRREENAVLENDKKAGVFFINWILLNKIETEPYEVTNIRYNKINYRYLHRNAQVAIA
jgi:hypothetical protein